jgi:DNA-binding MarR family transcriptional regulator
MRKIPEDTVISLFELRFSIENVFFRAHMKQYDFPKGINQTHMKALLMLRHCGAQSMSELSKKLNLEKGSFTPVANKLIEEGFVFKERNENDKRVYILSLTELGTRTANKFKSDHLEFIKKYLEQLSEKEKKELDEALVTVTNIVERFEGEKAKCNDLHEEK